MLIEVTALAVWGTALAQNLIATHAYEAGKAQLLKLKANENHDLAKAVVEAWKMAAISLSKESSGDSPQDKKKRLFFDGLARFGKDLSVEDLPESFVLVLTVSDQKNYEKILSDALPDIVQIIQDRYTNEKEWHKHTWYSDANKAFQGALLYCFSHIIKQPNHEKAFKAFLRDNFRALNSNQQITNEMLQQVLDRLSSPDAGGADWLALCERLEKDNHAVIIAVELVGISIDAFRADVTHQLTALSAQVVEVGEKVDRTHEFLRTDFIGMRDERDAAQKERDQKVGEVIALKEQLEIAGNKLVEAKVNHATNQQYLQRENDRIKAELIAATEALAKANAERNDPDVDALVQHARDLIAAGNKAEAYALFDQEDAEFAERKIQKMFVQLENADWTLAMETWAAQKVNANDDQRLKVATRLHELAEDAEEKGSYFKPLPLQLEAVALRQNLQGAEHPDTLSSMNNLAGLYDSQGLYSKAEPLYVETLRLRQQVLGAEHPDTLTSMNNLASVYYSDGHYPEAEQLALETLRLRQQVLGAEHPDTLMSMSNLARLYTKQGRSEAAEPLAIESLRLSLQVLGAEHPNTIGSMISLAQFYFDQERYTAAEPLFVDALLRRKHVLGAEHPDTLTSMGDLACLYFEQRRELEAESTLAETLRLSQQVLGPEDPYTLNTMAVLVALFDRQGKYQEAEPLYEEILRLRIQVLGAEHLDTLASMYNLAICYHHRGRPEKCEEMLQEVERLSRHLDDEVPLRELILAWVSHLEIVLDP
jgi:tetratricopeptide (TPR) repeat protein